MYTGGSQLYSAKEVEHKLPLGMKKEGGGVGTPEAEPLESVQLQYPPLVLPLDGNYLQCEGRVVFFLFSVYHKEEVTYNLKSRFIPRLYIQNISHDRRHHCMHTLTLTHHTRVSNSF